MTNHLFHNFISFLNDLEQKGINYTLAHTRDESIMVFAAAPGERWEIELLEDGSWEIERFISNGEIFDEESLKELFARYSDEDEDKHALPEVRIPAPEYQNRPTFQIYKDIQKQWRWRFVASNSRIISISPDAYPTKDDCLDNIEMIKKSSVAPIVDLSE